MKTAFIGLDYIFDIVHPDGKMKLLSQIAKVIKVEDFTSLRD